MITSLSLTNFRSYDRLHLDVESWGLPKSVILTGPNGAGKTNLLEAISLLSPGRGLRAAPLRQLARHGAPAWSVSANLPATTITTSLNGAAKRSFKTDPPPPPPLLWLTPSLERAIAESASARRRFLDRMVMSLEPEHGAHCAKYERAMRERNQLLQENDNAVWLDGIEDIMAREGAIISAARRRTIALLADILKNQPLLPLFPQLRIALAPEPDAKTTDTKQEQNIEQEQTRLRSRLHEMRPQDRRAGRTLAGPHRCDLRIRQCRQQQETPLESCSSGEQKALLLALVLAHGRLLANSPRGAPILLLDEVAAHLDASRRRALFDILAQSGAYSWMTGVDTSLFDGCQQDSCFLSVSAAGVVPAANGAHPARN